MDRDSVITLLFVFIQFVIQPVLIAIGARRMYHRSGTLWGLLSFGMNIGLWVFFDSRLRGFMWFEAAAQVVTIMSLSAISIFAALEVLRKGPHAPNEEGSPVNLRRGLFRVWTTISGVWIAFSVIEYIKLPPYCYSCVSTNYISFKSYWDVGKWFIGIPALAFIFCVILCWTINGFRRSPNRLHRTASELSE